MYVSLAYYQQLYTCLLLHCSWLTGGLGWMRSRWAMTGA